MNWTRVLVGAVAAAVLGFAPSASAAVTAGVSGTTLTVTGTGDAATPDVITVTLPGDATTQPAQTTDYVVHDPAGATPNPGCVQGPDAFTVHCSRSNAAWGAFRVVTSGGVGDDTIRHIAPVITAATEASTGDLMWIRGNEGNDILVGSENNDFMTGDAGNDVIEGYAGNDVITGGSLPGTDDPVSGLPDGVDYFAGSMPASTTAGTDRLFGGAGSDQMSDGDSDVSAVPTADTISGLACQGTGETPAVMRPGVTCPIPADTINVSVTENDIDELFWGNRTRAVRVNTASPSAQGGCPTTAACTTGGENELIIGIRGVYSGAGNDTLTGHTSGAGVGNTFYGGAGNDAIDGLDGNDELIGGPGSDNIKGGDGADILNPGGIITSAANAPTVMTSDGQDTVDGGAGGTDTTGDGSTAVSLNDSITYAGRTDNLTLDLNATSGWGAAGENDLVSNVEDVTAGHGADTITTKAGLGSIIEADPVAPETAHPGEPVLGPAPPNGYYSDDNVHARNGVADTIYCGGVAPDLDTDTVVADRTPADVLAADCEVVDLPPIPQPACGDGVDNDGDGAVDLADVGCTNAQDNDETNATTGTPPACADSRDNDGDGKIDFPADPGCAAAGDTSETDPTIDPVNNNTGNASTNRVRITGPSTIKSVKVKRNGTFTLSRVIIRCPSGNRNCSVRTTVAVTARKAANYTLRAGRSAAARGKLGKKQLSQLRNRRSLKATVTIRVVRNGVAITKKVKVTFKR